MKILFVALADRHTLWHAKSVPTNAGQVFYCRCGARLGLLPMTGDCCPTCGGRVEEVIRETSRRT